MKVSRGTNHYLEVIVCLTLFGFINAAGLINNRWEHNALVNPKDKQQMRQISAVHQEVLDKGCNMNLCFALDGSKSISENEFTDQKNFVDLIVAITGTDRRANYCAVQYHSNRTPISPLTGNKDTFLRRVQAAKLKRGGTNIAAGIRYATHQLRSQVGDANKLVLLGDGFKTVGRSPKSAARSFLRVAGPICAVAVGPSDIKGLTDITGDANRVFNIGQFLELSEIIVQVVVDVCELRKIRTTVRDASPLLSQ